MMDTLDQIARWLTELGIHPILGAFVAGLVAALLVRSRRPHAAIEGQADVGVAEAAASRSGFLTKSSSAIAHSTTSLAIDGTPVPIGPKVMADLVAKIRSGHRVDAIKLAREETGLGLAESKLLVETLAKSPLMR